MREQALCGWLVLAKVPDRPVLRNKWREPSLGPRRHAVRPQLLGNLGRIALGYRPRAWWVHYERTLAGDEPLVVGGVVPGGSLRREELGTALVVVERLPHGISFDHDPLVLRSEERRVGIEFQS